MVRGTIATPYGFTSPLPGTVEPTCLMPFRLPMNAPCPRSAFSRPTQRPAQPIAITHVRMVPAWEPVWGHSGFESVRDATVNIYLTECLSKHAYIGISKTALNVLALFQVQSQ